MFIGNDLIDLVETRMQAHHPRFARRILSDLEWNRFHELQCCEVFLWKAWSAKEAVYKLIKQQQPQFKFSPKTIELDDQLNIASFSSVSFKVDFILSDDLIYCYTVPLNNDVYHYLEQLPENIPQSVSIRSFAINKISEIFDWNKKLIEIRKDEFNIPKVFLDAKKTSLGISFTHHGRFMGISICH